MITTITTTTTVVILQQAAMFTALGIVVLITSLVAKELLNPTEGKMRLGSLARPLRLTILPLLFAFVVIVAMKIWEVI